MRLTGTIGRCAIAIAFIAGLTACSQAGSGTAPNGNADEALTRQAKPVQTAEQTAAPQPAPPAVDTTAPQPVLPAVDTTVPQPVPPAVGVKEEANLPQEHADVVLIGSELEGLYLARAAADEGLSVRILDPRAGFGGQLLQGEMLFLDATSDAHGKSLMQGRVKELFDGFKNGKIRKLPEFKQYIDKLVKGIPVESGIRIEQVDAAKQMDGSEHIAAIVYTGSDGAQHRITASTWVENTDFAALASRLDVTRLPGLERFYGQARVEYMSTGYMMKFKNVNWKAWMTAFEAMKPEDRKKKFGTAYMTESYALVFDAVTKSYKPTNDRLFLRGLNAVNQRDGDVLINALLLFDVNPADDASVASAMELGKKEMPLILDHFRKNLPGWERAELNGFPAYPYIREYNHYETDYTLQVTDMLSGRMFPDNVSIGGYPLDLQGITANKWGTEMGRPDKYGMPLRSFLLKGYDNVVLAGKNVGSSAIAYGSARIQPNTSAAAESIGVILGELRGTGYKLTQVPAKEMEHIQQLLAAKHQIKLTGIVGDNKLTGWTADELRKLDSGEINFTTYRRKK